MGNYVPWYENYIPEPNSGCWLWLGGCTGSGYGVCYPSGRDSGQFRTHRIMYELHKGMIPEGMDILHSCDNPICCNPDHLRPGTKLDNARDKVIRGRTPDQRGERGPGTKLTSAEVLEIRASTETHTKLGAKYGVHQSQISRIKSGKRW